MNETADKSLARNAAKSLAVQSPDLAAGALPSRTRPSDGRRGINKSFVDGRSSLLSAELAAGRSARTAVRASVFVMRMWLTEWGHGETARPIILITDDSRCPKPLAFIEGGGQGAREMASRIVSGKAPLSKADSDLTFMARNDFRSSLTNLMYPVKPFDEDHFFDESDPMLAAARYTPTSNGNAIARFTTFTRQGLEQLFMDIPIMRCGPALEKAMGFA